MWREILAGKEAMEDVAQRLVDENRQIADDLEFVQGNFGGLIAFYEIAVLAYNQEADESAVKTFADLIGMVKAEGFDKALAAAAEIAPKG